TRSARKMLFRSTKRGLRLFGGASQRSALKNGPWARAAGWGGLHGGGGRQGGEVCRAAPEAAGSVGVVGVGRPGREGDVAAVEQGIDHGTAVGVVVLDAVVAHVRHVDAADQEAF